MDVCVLWSLTIPPQVPSNNPGAGFGGFRPCRQWQSSLRSALGVQRRSADSSRWAGTVSPKPLEVAEFIPGVATGWSWKGRSDGGCAHPRLSRQGHRERGKGRVQPTGQSPHPRAVPGPDKLSQQRSISASSGGFLSAPRGCPCWSRHKQSEAGLQNLGHKTPEAVEWAEDRALLLAREAPGAQSPMVGAGRPPHLGPERRCPQQGRED